MATTSFTQSGVQQSNSIESQYINKVKILPDGTLQVTKTNLLPKNIVLPLPSQTPANANTNQITRIASSADRVPATVPVVTTLDSQGINSGNNPVGPPPSAITE